MRNERNGYQSQAVAATQAASILGTLKLAASLIETGRSVDLQGLDDLVGRLCARTLDLPFEQGQQLRPQLVQIADAITRLDEAMKMTAPDQRPV